METVGAVVRAVVVTAVGCNVGWHFDWVVVGW